MHLAKIKGGDITAADDKRIKVFFYKYEGIERSLLHGRTMSLKNVPIPFFLDSLQFGPHFEQLLGQPFLILLGPSEPLLHLRELDLKPIDTNLGLILQQGHHLGRENLNLQKII